LFLVTDIPREFRELLVKAAVLEVNSSLKTLFFEDGNPIPHDYVTTLKNYNLPVDTEEDKAKAIEEVRKSVVDNLFSCDTSTGDRLRSFLLANCDNLPMTFTEEQVQVFVRNSIRVELLQVIEPLDSILLPVYNLYIYPPTRIHRSLENWRKWLAKQTHFAGQYGVGERYGYEFSCVRCKSIDHPEDLCPYSKESDNEGIEEDSDDDPLPDKKCRASAKPNCACTESVADKGKARKLHATAEKSLDSKKRKLA
jgi:hypothetical protein